MSLKEAEMAIAERVKFWEEQDRINKELIPRVVKNHELISDLAIQVNRYTDQSAKLKNELNKLAEDSKKIQKDLTELKVEFKELKNLITKSAVPKSDKNHLLPLILSILAIIASITSVIW